MEPSPTEEPLLGGNATEGIVRVGNTVRRPQHPWSASVDALLTHFSTAGIKGVPRALGYDQQGRQMLSYVEGTVDPEPSDLSVSRLFQVGELIRQLHDSAESFEPTVGAQWDVLITPDHTDLICHHDLGPWNLVRTETQLTFIDWDGAGPGSRLWDVAYAAHGFVPLSPRSGLSDDGAAARLRSLIDGYQLGGVDRALLTEMLGPRTRAMYEFLKASFEAGSAPWNRLWLEGHGQMWLEDADYIDDRCERWRAALI